MMMRRRSRMRREWTVAVVQASGEMESLEAAGKQEIMRRTGVAARDLRRLVSSSSSRSRITIVGRECSIVINLEHIKAIITANEALFMNSKDPSLTPLLQNLHNRIVLPPSSPINILPFELVALEACLQAASTSLQNDADILEQESHTALDNLTLEICTLNLERVRQIKSRLLAITRRAQKVRDELENLLDDDEHMSQMYLTNKLLAHQSLSSDNHRIPSEITMEESWVSKKSNVEEVEMLLGAYFVEIGGTLNKLFSVREEVEETEEYINGMLHEKENKLLQMAVRVGTATVIMEAFITVLGILAINIHIELFDKHGLFLWITGGCAACSIFLYVSAILWYRHKHLLD